MCSTFKFYSVFLELPANFWPLAIVSKQVINSITTDVICVEGNWRLFAIHCSVIVVAHVEVPLWVAVASSLNVIVETLVVVVKTSIIDPHVVLGQLLPRTITLNQTNNLPDSEWLTCCLTLRKGTYSSWDHTTIWSHSPE